MTGIDLQAEVEAKIAKNVSREYRRLSNGTPVKDSTPDLRRKVPGRGIPKGGWVTYRRFPGSEPGNRRDF